MAKKTAAILAIGDELLSGRTRDANIHYLANWLAARAIDLVEARIVADDKAAIVEALNGLRARVDYCFTSGGIGPTHDDITYDAVAAAFGRKIASQPEAARLITNWYAARGEVATPARLRMAQMPEGAELIANPVSGAPGVRVGNVFVMAGVPSIFIGMLGAIDGVLDRGDFTHSRAVTAMRLAESRLAEPLREIQRAAPGVSIGSYPIDGDEKGVTIIARSLSVEAAEGAIARVAEEMRRLGAEPVAGERDGR